MDLYFYQYWKDDRLDIGQDRNISITGKAVDKIWKPDTYFVNAKKPEIHEVLLSNRMMNISEHGHVQYMARISLKSHCRVELRKYPFDNQTCDMVIESFSLTDDSLVYKWKDINRTVTVFDNEMAQFDFEYLELLYSHQNLASPGFSDLYARFHFKRRTSYIILQIYFPSLLITLLSFVAFWIPENAVPARVTLSVTSVLTIIYFEKAVDARMPNISYVKAIDYHLYASLLFIFFSLIEYALVLNIKLTPRSDTADAMTSSHEKNIEIQSPTLRRRLGDNNSEQKGDPSVTNRANVKVVVNNVHIVDRISRVLFPLLYCLFAVSYWISWHV